ncbi:type II secretion system protein [Candidatus Daviesbacteria bacterium]|nr:type II secretion system protein [Candidatus Daviesbacteria bacterium]
MKGLTLIEVLVAMGIAAVVGALLVVILVNSAGMFTEQSSKVQEGLNINDALSQVRRSIKDAGSVAESYDSGETLYTTGGNQLVLKVASVDASGNLLVDTFDYFVFLKDQTYLRFKTFPDPASSRQPLDTVLSIGVDSLAFQYFNSASPPLEVTPAAATKVRISLTLNQTNIATSEANLRND